MVTESTKNLGWVIRVCLSKTILKSLCVVVSPVCEVNLGRKSKKIFVISPRVAFYVKFLESLCSGKYY